MTFEALETSALSQPVEYLSFKNGSSLWYYTNSNINEVIGARTFAPLAYSRNEPVFSKDTSDGQIKFTVPSNIPLIEFYETLPSSSISSITIERVNRNDPDGGVQIFWKGSVASVQREGDYATILAVPQTQLPAQVPRYTYSGLCNWFLFQDRCGLDRTAWRHSGVVSTVGTPATILTVTGLRTQAQALADSVSPNTLTAQQIDDYWLGGYAENADGEKRAVYATDVDGVPDRIRLLQPFRNMNVTDTLTVYAGCDRTRDTCAAKFSNHLKHGGFPDIPTLNPFVTELPSGAGSSEKKAFYGNS
jgi:uncharacterized phage protein (TIGR02218 family)